MPKLDLNAKRAERAAKRAEPFTVDLNGEGFELVPELPLALGDPEKFADLQAVVRLILANPDTDFDRFLAAGPTVDDVVEIASFYGVTLGESLASMQSSASTGAPSKPTSNASTDLTSPSAATANKPSMPAG